MTEKSVWKIIKERMEKANKNHRQFDKTARGKQLDFDFKINLMLYFFTAAFVMGFLLIFILVPKSYSLLLFSSFIFVVRFNLLAGLIVSVALFVGIAYVISALRYANAYSKWKTKRGL
ncbi:MAG: hypothetical protein M0Z70_06690 [Nitrospiraceae bacterium]|jgi:hypothetical protein|nr:hypothetical protein [Nitrospiraceae bacterium]